MAKVKILALILLLALLLIGIFFWFKNRPSGKPPKEINDLIEQTEKAPEGVIEGAKDFLAAKTHQTSQDLSNLLTQKKQEVINKLQGEERPEVKVISQVSPNADDKLIVIDLAKENDLVIAAKTNQKYYLVFRNVPANYCLYIQETQYPIKEDLLLELIFSQSGNFLIKTNLCDLKYKEHGVFVVE